MKFKVELRPEAFADVAEAFSYYERQRVGLGVGFEAELHQTVQLLGDMARAAPSYIDACAECSWNGSRSPSIIGFRVKR